MLILVYVLAVSIEFVNLKDIVFFNTIEIVVIKSICSRVAERLVLPFRQ